MRFSLKALFRFPRAARAKPPLPAESAARPLPPAPAAEPIRVRALARPARRLAKSPLGMP